MNNNIPEIKNPLQHNGTNRFERLGAEMDFDYVKIEERHEQDFLRYAEKLAEGIRYFDNNNQPFGNWKSFFDSNVPENRPHKALFIAFLRLLEALNQHANGLTKRHLDFYYREILSFIDREAKPSQVHLFFKCAKTIKTRFIEKGAQVYAGDNKDGKRILYELIDEIVVNNAELTDFNVIYKHSDSFNNKLYSKDYTDLVLGDHVANKNGISTFGENQLVYTKNNLDEDILTISNDPTMDLPEVGFALSSPVLRMEEGERLIHLTFLLSSENNTTFNTDLFNFEITSEEGWIPLALNSANQDKKGFHITLALANTDAAVTDYNADVHNGQYASTTPVIRFLLKNQEEYGYLASKNLQLVDAKLHVEVKGMRSLIVQNEQSTLDPSKPFRPFGPLPKLGGHFYVGHAAIFSNELTEFKVNIQWKDLPNKQFNQYYQNYTVPVNNESFKVAVAYLQSKEWSLPLQQPLFSTDIHSGSEIQMDTTGYTRKIAKTNIKNWDYKADFGFIRMTLQAPDDENFSAFGHNVYTKEVMRINQYNATQPSTNNHLQINPPYTPVIEQLTADYTTAPVAVSINKADQFYHITPFGQKSLQLNDSLSNVSLLPSYNYEGELFIGLKQLELPQSINLLFQFIEGTADVSQSQIKSGVDWFYLKGNDWVKIDQLKISKDTTRNLLNTGIIRFDLPEDMDANHQIMPDGKFWIKAAIPQKSAGIDRLQSLHIHAIDAKEVTPALYNDVIPPNSISKLLKSNQGIAEVKQPYASYGGTNLDNESTFYAHITERLRHKDRGVMIWDYERLVLNQFMELYKVKCLNHTNYQTELVAGHVMMAIIPNLRNRGVSAPFQPKLSIHKRMEIYDFLRERISPFIYLRIENPIYEPIQLSFNVGFHQGKDEGFYGKKLHQQLQEFLSPWAFENELSKKSDLVFGGELHKSTILKFIEDLDYVDFVNDFNMYHIYRDPSIADKFNKVNSAGNLILNQTNYHSSSQEEGPCSRILMRFKSEEKDALVQFIDIKVRLLKGLVELEPSEDLESKFRRQLYNLIKSRSAKGQVITKTLLQILIKNIHYIDRVIALDFFVNLPDGYIKEDVDVAIAKTSRSVMVTAEQHRIGVYSSGDYNCEGNVVIGIGFMIVEADFIVPQIKEENYEYKAR